MKEIFQLFSPTAVYVRENFLEIMPYFKCNRIFRSSFRALRRKQYYRSNCNKLTKSRPFFEDRSTANERYCPTFALNTYADSLASPDSHIRPNNNTPRTFWARLQNRIRKHRNRLLTDICNSSLTYCFPYSLDRSIVYFADFSALLFVIVNKEPVEGKHTRVLSLRRSQFSSTRG